MKIKTDTLHYKLYSSSYSIWNGDPPEQTNLCQYVRRLAFAPLNLLLAAFLLTFSYLLVALRSVVVYPFGYSTHWKSMTLNLREPARLRIRGFSFYPGYVLFPIAFIAINCFIYTNFPAWSAKNISMKQSVAIIAMSLEIVAGVAGLIAVAIIFFTSDTYDLITEYLDAKTDGVCPLVEFEEEDNGNQ